MGESDLFYRDYPRFGQRTTMTRAEFNARWGAVRDEFSRLSNAQAPPVDISHVCVPSCCETGFVSNAFSRTALCLMSGKLHVCEIGGYCPQVTRTDSGDLVCCMTGSVVGVDNILTSYDDGDRATLQDRVEVAQGGIDATDATTIIPETALLDPDFRAMLAEIEGLSPERAVCKAVQNTPRRPQTKTKAAPTAVLAGEIINAILRKGADGGSRGKLDEREHVLLYTRAPGLIHSLFESSLSKRPHGPTYYKAFVYAFLDILAKKGIPGMQEGPMVALRSILPRQGILRSIQIQTANVSRAEREINSLIAARKRRSRWC
jgi:hypothetical protein